MEWLFGNKKSNLPAATHLQQQRSKQIESLKRFNHNVTEIQRDVEYRVTTTTGASTISFNITLPPLFPQERPIVKVTPPVRHPWVNDHMEVTGCQGINNFTVHTDLGSTIRSIVLEFTNNPPTLYGPDTTMQSPSGPLPYPAQPQGHVPYQSYPTNPVASSQVVNPGIQSYLPQVPMPTFQSTSTPVPGSCSYIMPTVPASFPELKGKTIAELQQLNDESNEYQMIQYLQELPQVKKLQTDRQDLCNANEDLAKINIRKKPALEANKSKLLEKYDELTTLRRKFDEECLKQQKLNERFRPEAVMTNLKIASLEAEEESDKIAELFLDKKLDIETFVQQFMDKRKLSHVRKGKEEKLNQLLQRRY